MACQKCCAACHQWYASNWFAIPGLYVPMDNIRGIKHRETSDRKNERRILEFQKHWYNLFVTLIDIIHFLAYHSLAFRGHRESLKTDEGTKNSGNSIDLFKLIAKYGPMLWEYKNRIESKQVPHHYLSHDIQNELITIMSNSYQ
ncbi:TTF-type domain-containing protein [Trichonephila clavipes]|nr:TTF-type domain-containing protein [Trichonephila clavipes]